MGKSGSFIHKGNFITYLLGFWFNFNGKKELEEWVTWLLEPHGESRKSALQGCCSSTCIYISWQKLHLCTQLISRTGWKTDALLCTMQFTHWDAYMKNAAMMKFILRRWLIGSLQCCPFHATLWKEKKITIKGNVEAPNSSMKCTFTVIYDLELSPEAGREMLSGWPSDCLQNSAGVLPWGGGKWKE